MKRQTAESVVSIAPRADTVPAWPRVVLKGAAVYNVAWGATVVAFPEVWFRIAGMTAPAYPWLFQCIGMIVAVFGLGYWIAASDPRRYWPIVFVGLLGKVLGPIGFVWTMMGGEITWRFGATIVTNDLLWWIPFGLVLLEVYRQSRLDAPGRVARHDRPDEAMRRYRTIGGRTLSELSEQSPLLIVFLRHAGCTFCREALSDLRNRRREIEDAGTRIVVVHMGEESIMTELEFRRFGLDDVERVSDPERDLYRAFELRQGSLGQLFGLKVWWRGLDRHAARLRRGRAARGRAADAGHVSRS